MNSLKSKIEILKNGGVGILMTDTLYGILGQALNKKTVERIYKIKGRNKNKPFIILISDIDDLKKFGVQLDPSSYTLVAKFWPGKISIIFPLDPPSSHPPSSKTSDGHNNATEEYGKPQTLNPNFKYLHRGKKSLAFRLPKNKRLLSILKKTGPLIAPSANPQAQKPAKSIAQAKKYFGDKVDFYIDSGLNRRTRPSTLIKIEGNKVVTLRK